jgi:DNA polymerase (family 10)
MDKLAVRSVLEHIAAFLELKGETAPRVRLYQDAARRELAATGRSATLDELREQIPPGLVEMLGIPGLGVGKVRQIHERLHIESLAELEDAAADGQLTAEDVLNTRDAEGFLAHAAYA